MPLYLGVFLVFSLGGSVLAQDERSLPDTRVPLEQLLNSDGTLNLESGIQGSVDRAGWQMVTSPNGKPRFMPASTAQQAVSSAQFMATPGDENWDDRFSLNGFNSHVRDLAVDGNGNVYASNLGDRASITHFTEFVLEQNTPNPFNPVTAIPFAVPRASVVRLKIYNLAGQEVATLVDQPLAPGAYKISWDASRLVSGVYIYRLEAEGFVQTKRLLLMK